MLLSALLTGLACLARYAGIAFVASAGVILLANLRVGPNKQPGEKAPPSLWEKITLRDLLLYGLVALLPTLIWLVVDFALTGTVASRSGQPASAYWQRFLEIGPALEKIYLFWLIPDSLISRLPGMVRAVLWAVPPAAWGCWMVVEQESRRLVGRCAHPLHSPLCEPDGSLYAGISGGDRGCAGFTFPPVTLAARMFSPVHLAALALIFALVALALAAFPVRSRYAIVLAYAVLLGLFGSYALRGFLVSREYHRTGIGYSSPAWQNSEVLAEVRKLPGTSR